MSETRTATADPDGMFSQVGRSIAIDTPLGPDALLLTSVQGQDRISHPFVYTVEFLTMAGDSAVRGLIGKRVTLWLQNNHESWRRPVNGYVRRITGQATSLRGYGGYRAEVVPRLWFLDCTADCRIFQSMTYPAIIKTLLDENGVTGCDFKLLKTDYPIVDYCVQYRESALAFISRLMEHVGIFFFHEHSAADHRLVITDANSFTKFTTPRQLRTGTGAETGDIQKVWSDTMFRPGAWVLTDYDFEAPSKLMKKQVKTTLSVAMMPQHEWFDFPGGYTDQEVGTWLTRVRMEAEEAHHDKLLGLGSTAAMDPGFRFDLVHSGSVDDQPASYLVTEVRHRAQERSYFHESAAEYCSEFVAIPAATQFRPERVTPKSVVRGSQTATVVSPSSGDPIYTDEYGRVKVHFHWDRRGKRSTGATSCWVRVAQNSAGAGFGGIAIPHAGQEVVVDFLEGDPDRPLIVGRVHNAEKIAPLELPADKHKTITRDHGGNKIVMDGEAGAQHLTLISPKTMNFVVASGPAQSLSAAAVDAGPPAPGSATLNWGVIDSASGQVFGDSPGIDALKTVFTAIGKPNQSGDSGDYNMNTIVSHDNNSFTGGSSNAYTLGNANSFIKGDSLSHTHGTSKTRIDVDSMSEVYGRSYSFTEQNSDTVVNHNASTTIGIASWTKIGGKSTTDVGGESYTYNRSSAYSRTFGLNTSLSLLNSTTTVLGNNNSVTAGICGNLYLSLVRNVGRTNSKDYFGGDKTVVAEDYMMKCTKTYDIESAQKATLHAMSGGIYIEAPGSKVLLDAGGTRVEVNPSKLLVDGPTAIEFNSAATTKINAPSIKLG